MLTRKEVNAIYDPGRETVVHVLLEMSRKIDHLMADVTALKDENLTLQTKYQALQEKVNDLEGRLAKTSRNSHKPPTSDGLAKPKPKRGWLIDSSKHNM